MRLAYLFFTVLLIIIMELIATEEVPSGDSSTHREAVFSPSTDHHQHAKNASVIMNGPVWEVKEDKSNSTNDEPEYGNSTNKANLMSSESIDTKKYGNSTESNNPTNSDESTDTKYGIKNKNNHTNPEEEEDEYNNGMEEGYGNNNTKAELNDTKSEEGIKNTVEEDSSFLEKEVYGTEINSGIKIENKTDKGHSEITEAIPDHSNPDKDDATTKLYQDGMVDGPIGENAGMIEMD